MDGHYVLQFMLLIVWHRVRQNNDAQHPCWFSVESELDKQNLWRNNYGWTSPEIMGKPHRCLCSTVRLRAANTNSSRNAEIFRFVAVTAGNQAIRSRGTSITVCL